MHYAYPSLYASLPTLMSTQKEDFSAAMVPSTASPELQQRIFAWLKNVQPFDETYHDLVPISHPTRTRTTRISSKPYARPESSKPLARRASNIPAPEMTSPVTELCGPWPTYGEVPAGILHTLQHNPVQYRIPPSKLNRGLDDLPERVHNPLVTHSPDELREEYRRIVSLYNALEEKRHQIEGAWRARGMPPVAMDEVVSINNSLRRLVDSAQYIVDFASEWSIEVDFYQVFSRYRCPPIRTCQCLPTASMPQQLHVHSMHMGPDDSVRRQSVM